MFESRWEITMKRGSTMSATRRRFLQYGTFSVLSVGAAALLAACSSAAPPSPTAPPAAPTSAPTAAASVQPTVAATTVAQAAPTVASSAPTVAPAVTTAAKATGPVTINHYLSGDVNIRDLWSKTLLPAYQKVNPSVTINVTFSEHGTGDATTFDRIAAAKQAGKPSGVDSWETGNYLLQGGQAGLIEKLSPEQIPNLAKVPSAVIGQYDSYGVPYRGSSVVLAYNSKEVSNPPKTLDDLLKWIKNNPGKFTYNPPDTGGSGAAFVTRVLMMGIPDSDLKLFQTGYDQSKESEWDKGWATLKDLNSAIYNNGFYPKGNVPVLQTLGKDAISVAPVWSDQGLQYLNQKLLPPEVKLLQIDPPFSGGGAFIGVIADSQNKSAVYAWLNWVLTPEPQQMIIDTIQGYPGLDWQYMPDAVRQKFADIAKNFSFGFSAKFSSDMNQQW